MNEFLTNRVVKATFDATNNTANRPTGTYYLNVLIPAGAIITKAYYNVRTTFATAGGDAGTIALQSAAANDLKAAIAVSDGTNVWDAGLHACLPGKFALDGNALTAIAMAAADAGACILTTSAVQPAVVVGGQALTGGILDLYIEYVV
jgi:hypothetical protein